MSWIKAVGRSKAAPKETVPPLHLRLSDWTGHFRDGNKFAEGLLDQLTLPGEMTAVAYEPGTSAGSVHLFGAPSVRLSFMLRPALKVKHLLFKSDTYLLICIDEKDNLSVYDLSRRDPHALVVQGSRASHGGAPAPTSADVPLRLGIHTARNRVLCTEVSPTHSHLFMGLADGTVDAYDLERFAPASHRIPNLWWNEEEILRRSNVPNAPSRLHIPLIIDIQTHPRDPGTLLLCYEGGAILYNLRESTPMHTFQLRLLPGAPGPCADAPMEEIWSERLCPATAIAWSPCGEMFVMGHENGVLSFWSVKDEDKPLTVRTLDDMDIERPVAPEDMPTKSAGPREPIFKVQWSALPAPGWLEYGSQAASAWTGANASPTGAGAPDAPVREHTYLTVMGGTPVRQTSACLYVFELPVSPGASAWSTGTSFEAQSRMRTALRAAIVPTNVAVYQTSGTVEDFCLLPRLSPHYGGTFDPYAVIVLVGADASLPSVAAQCTQRGLEAFSFPPQSTQPAYVRHALPLPLEFVGRGTLLGHHVETVPLALYRRLVHGAPELAEGCVVPHQPMGGYASPKVVHAPAEQAEALAAQGQPRLLVTWHLDGTVRWHDVSPHLLLFAHQDAQRGPILREAFPAPLPHLTIAVRDLVMHPSVIGLPALEPLQRFPMQLQVHAVDVAWEALECCITLTTGHVLNMTLASGSAPGRTMPGVGMPSLTYEDTPSGPLPEFTPMSSACDALNAGFQPNVMMHVLPGRPTCQAISDVGLWAMATEGLLVVADMHKHDIVVRCGFGAADFYSRQLGAQEAKIVEAEGRSAIDWLKFSVCRTAADPMLALRLLVGYADGAVTVWTFERSSLDSWFAFRGDAVHLKARGKCVFAAVFDGSGEEASAVEGSVQRAIIEQEGAGSGGVHDTQYLLVVYQHQAVLQDQITGARISHTEWPDPVLGAGIVHLQGAKVLLSVAANSLFVTSLPRMDTTHRLQRHVAPSQEMLTQPPQVCVERQGHVFELDFGRQLRVWTATALMPHGEMPNLFLFTPRTLPLAPGAGATGYVASVAGWLGAAAGQSLSQGAQIDAILGGPKRPPVPRLPPRMTPERPAVPSVAAQAASAASAWWYPAAGTATPSATEPPPATSSRASVSSAAGSEAESGMGSWLGSYSKQISDFTNNSMRSQAHMNMALLHRRDELLSTLDEGVTSLERSAKEFFKSCVAVTDHSTRNAALKAAAKDKVNQYM